MKNKIITTITFFLILFTVYSVPIIVSAHGSFNKSTNLPTEKVVSITVKFPPASGRPPSQYHYDDGVYKGWIPLSYWEDLSDRYPAGYILGTYKGVVSRVAIPLNKGV